MSFGTLLRIPEGNVAMEIRPFASGGFADVFRARWARRPGEVLLVAVKFPRRREVDDQMIQESTRRFVREANLWAQLNHRNVVPFYGLIFDQGYPGLIMPYYDQGNLRRYLRLYPRVDRLSLIRGIAEGLCFLHNFEPNPIVHGDIKAMNIIVTDAGEARITDFGLARMLFAPGFTTSNLAGSYRWMSPEILRGDWKPTTSSDVWAFAMTIIEVYTGQAPFHYIKRDVAVIMEICNGHLPTRPKEGIDDTMWNLLQRCWDLNVDRRSSASVLVGALTAIAFQNQAAILNAL